MIKITSGDTTLVFNPISKKSKIKPTRFGADVVLISYNIPDMNGKEEMTRKEKTPFVIDGPGEYETNGLFVKGAEVKSNYEKSGINTIYSVNMDGMNILHLGALDNPKPNMSFLEDMDSLEIVFAPIGGQGVLSPQDAYKLAVSLEPKVIVPVHYAGLGEKDALKAFKDEAGSLVETVDKLNIKKKDVEGETMKVVVLES